MALGVLMKAPGRQSPAFSGGRGRHRLGPRSNPYNPNNKVGCPPSWGHPEPHQALLSDASKVRKEGEGGTVGITNGLLIHTQLSTALSVPQKTTPQSPPGIFEE